MALAKHFELLIRDDERFEIPARRHLGMVVFRLKGQNELTENLLKRLNSTGSCLNIICQVPCGKLGSKFDRIDARGARLVEGQIRHPIHGHFSEDDGRGRRERLEHHPDHCQRQHSEREGKGEAQR